MSLTDWHHRDPHLVLMILLSHQKGSPLSWSEAQTDHHLVVAGQGHGVNVKIAIVDVVCYQPLQCTKHNRSPDTKVTMGLNTTFLSHNYDIEFTGQSLNWISLGYAARRTTHNIYIIYIYII